MSDPFIYLKSINDNKENLMRDTTDDREGEKHYNPFLMNRGLSQFPDSILYCNEMNQVYHLDKKLQYEYLLYSIRKAKRFGKWAKAPEEKNVDIIRTHYGYNRTRALEALKLLTKDQVKAIKKFYTKGDRS